MRRVPLIGLLAVVLVAAIPARAADEPKLLGIVATGFCASVARSYTSTMAV